MTILDSINEVISGFAEGWHEGDVSPKHSVRRDKAVREELSEQQVDDMVEDSFPASDPPSTY